MNSKDDLRTCCVIKCVNINTPMKSEVNFFKFPETRYRSFQRNKWVQAVKSNNGPWWMPSAESLICSDHFVKGKPNNCPLDVDYTPSVFVNMRKGEIKSRTVSVKEFALEYIEHDALLEKPSKSNINTNERRVAYVTVAAALQIPVPTVRSWEKRFREYYEQKMAELAEKQNDNEDVKPHWLSRVAKRLGVPPVPRMPALGGTGAVATGAALSPGGAVSPGGVVAALCAAARARGTLCSTALYNDVRRSLRLSAAINDLHAVWVSVQRVSLEQVVVAARAGDAGPAPHTAAVADLVLLHTDVDMHRLITDESVTLYEESAALHTLWQLVQRHQLEDAAPMDARVRSQRWTRAHRDYLDSGRSASLVVLQRRWHELKLQARVRLAAHWRRRDPAPPDAAPPAPAAAPPSPAAAPPSPAPRDMYPRPAPIHISILKRYPHVATGAFKSWRQLVLDGAVVTEPLEEDANTEQTEGEGNKKPETTEPVQPDIKDIKPKTEKLAVDEPDIEKTAANELAVEQSLVDEALADETTDNDQKVDDPPVVETKCKPLVKQTTTGDPLAENLTAVQPTADEPMDTDMMNEQSASNDSLTAKPTVNELKVEQNMITDLRVGAADNPEVTVQLTVKDFQAVHAALNTSMDICDILDELDATDDLETVKPAVNDLKVEQNTVNDSSADDPATGQPMANDLAAEQPTANDLLVVPPDIFKRMYNNLLDEQGMEDNQLLLKKPKIEQATNKNHLADNPVTEETTNSVLLDGQGTTNDRLLLKEPKVEQVTNIKSLADNPGTEETMNSILLDEQGTTSDRLLLKEPKVEQVTNIKSLADNPGTEETMNSILLDEQGTTGDRLLLKEPKFEQATNKNHLADNPVTEETTNSVLLDGQGTTNDRLLLKEPKVEQVTNIKSLADNPGTEETMNSILLDEQGTTGDRLLLKEPKVEQVTNIKSLADNPGTEETMNSILLDEQGTTGDRLLLKEPKVEQVTNIKSLADNPGTEETMNSILLDEQDTTSDRLLLKEPKVEQTTNNNPLADNTVTEETINSVVLDEQPTITNPEVIQTTGNDLTVEQSKVDNPLPKKSQNSLLLALLAADSDNSEIETTINFCKTKRFMDSLKNQRMMSGPAVRSIGEHAVGVISPEVHAGPDIHERLELSSELVLHDEDKSNEVTRPYYQANSSHVDTDSEDNLVIDECSNNTPCLLEPEPMANTEIHGVDTALPHMTLENAAPTIQVLQMIDPSTVKKEILFESDEEDSQPCIEEDKVDIGIKKEVSVMANKIVFANEELGVSDVKTEDDVTERMDGDDLQDGDDLVDDTPAIDHKLLMETKVLLFRIDKTRPWRNNVRKDNSIRVSRIHRRFYTPSTKKYYYTPMSNNKTKNTSNKTKKNCRLKPRNRKSQPKSRNNTSNSNDHANTETAQEIKIDDACLERVANTHSVRQLCRNIKREMIDDTLEDPTPKKRVKTESDSDDNPSQTVRNVRETEIQSREEQTETADAPVEKELVEVLSSDDELMNDELLRNLGWEDKRKKAPTRAASSVEWSSQFAPVFGGRVSKRVMLPDRAQLRRRARGAPVAQVAPISTTVNTTETCGKDSAPVDTSGDAADDDTPLAWRALDLPTDEQLAAALDELTSPCSVEQVLERAHCCAARRHREVNDTRRRIGVPDLPLHTHSDGVCTCCCAHLSDSDARSRLDVQLRALHNDIERMLWKTAPGRIQSKLSQKHSRSPSPTTTNTLKPSTKDIPLNSSTEATSSKSKPIPTEAKVAKPTTYTNRSKKRRSKRAPTPTAEEPAPIVDYYEEWQRQKNMNAQYFHIKGLNSSKKNNSKAQKNVAQSNTSQSVTQSGAPPTVVQRTTPPTVVQSTIPQNVVQSTTPQNMVQSSPSTVAHNMTPLQNTSTGLMPYIRESRLIAPVGTSPVTHTIEVPTLVPVIYPLGMPSGVTKPQRGAPPSQRGAPPSLRGAPPSQLPRPNPRTIAPKPESMRLALEAKHKSVEEKPQMKTQLTNPFIYQTSQPRRMNLTTTQIAEPEPSTSEPVVKPVSILEEYSRTLSTAPRSMPVVNALSLRVPNGPEGPKTTIVMALNLPSDNVIKQTINTLYANDTVDLTNEPETSSDVTKPPEVQKTVPPVCDIVGVVKGLINAGNKTLEPSSSTASKSLLKVNLEKQSEAPKPRTKTPKIMSLTKSLYVGDVIEIDDTDSNSDDSSNGSHSSKSNSSIPINKSSDASPYCNEKSVCSNDPVVYDNKTSKLANSSNTKTVSQSIDVSSSEATNSIETKSDNSNSLLQAAEGGTDETLNQTVANINESVDQKESSNANYITGTISTTDVPVSNQLVKMSDLISNKGNSYQPNFNINKLTSEAPWNTRKKIEPDSKPTSSIQTVSTNISDKPLMTFCKIVPSSNTNNNTKYISLTTTSKKTVNKATASNQSVSKTTTSKKTVNKATASKKTANKATASKKTANKATASNQSVSKTRTSKKTVNKATASNQSVSKTTKSNQSTSNQYENVDLTTPSTSERFVSETTTSNQSVSNTHENVDLNTPSVSEQFLSKSNFNQSFSKTTTSNQSVSKTKASNQSVSKTKASNQSVSKTKASNQSVSKTKTSNQSVSKTTASKQSTSNINTTKDLSEDTSDNPAVGRVVPAVKKPSRPKTPQTRYRWHSMVQDLTDCSEDPAYAGIQTLKALLDDSQRCPARFADARAMPDFIAKLSTSTNKEGYCHKASAPEVSVSALPCGATLLCVDAASPPLVLKTQNEPLYKSMPHLRAHLVLTDADLPCKQPTYWTLASYRLMLRVVPDSPDVPDAPAGPVVASEGGGPQRCPEKGEGVMRKEDRMICEKNHSFKVWTAFCTADGVRQAARAGATLFLLNVMRARMIVLAIEKVHEPGGGRYRHRAIADVEPEILRNLENLIEKAEIEEQQSGRTNVIG